MSSQIIHLCSMREAEGSAVVNGRTWRWEFHHYLGPTFLRGDGEPLSYQPRENNPVWDHFEKWLDERQAQPTPPTVPAHSSDPMPPD